MLKRRPPMEPQKWILTDVSTHTWIETLDLNLTRDGRQTTPEAEVPLSVHKQVLHGGWCDGVDLITVINHDFSFSIIPTRGMGIWRAQVQDMHVGWNPPIQGPVHPKFVNLSDRGGLGWLSGFDELIVRCGLESNGAPGTDVMPDNQGNPTETPLTLHGRIANIPASKVMLEILPGDPPEIRVTGVVEESTLFFPRLALRTTISTTAGSNTLTIHDEVVNLKGTEAEMELLYHCNFGRPFLEKGAELLIPASERAPRDERAASSLATWNVYREPTAGFVEECYWHVPLGDAKGNTLSLLKNAAGTKGVAIRFNTGQLPCFSQWKNTAEESAGYVTGMEPATNFPNFKAFERKQKRTVTLPAGGSYTSDLQLEVYTASAQVQKAEQEISAIQDSTTCKIHTEPQARFSPLE